MSSSTSAEGAYSGENLIPTTTTTIALGNKIQVPPMGIGTWSWGDESKWGYSITHTENDIKQAFDELVTRGITFFDTAEIYGQGESERIVGRLLTHWEGKPERESMVIATKFLPLPWRFRYPSSLFSALQQSMERLGVKQIDLYQIHGPIHLRSIEVLADALADAVDAGLVRTVGVSNYSIDETTRMYKALKERGIQLATNQIEFSLLRRYPETNGLIRACREMGVEVLAYSPLGMGRLTGKYSATNPPPSGRKFGNYSMNDIEPLLDVLRQLALKYEKTVPQIALNWVICKGVIPIPGAKNLKQAQENCGALGWRMDDADIDLLDTHSFDGTTYSFWQHG
ncbi:Aldo/keto reductase [Basidiobolus meristosporus CBS 931.73]|uniref:Aldo/keto reductase n=1 Tax=Basidiobolus meristosporus CBS 931.73 TaxID=1314790 RepID=A0A1Y1XXP0_9FUNG|nr:Aldo/keto reductase [Basidiobolus meristosporus CBS 931.73]|eukprot:ORX90512.1 Aldo/keto reductase [Basidiobolus meristosporus CBS 931.73]